MPVPPPPPVREAIELNPIQIFNYGVQSNSPTFTDFRPQPVVVETEPAPKESTTHPSMNPQSPPSTGSQETPETDPGPSEQNAETTPTTDQPPTEGAGSSSPSHVVPTIP